jgi:hypothetical protein
VAEARLRDDYTSGCVLSTDERAGRASDTSSERLHDIGVEGADSGLAEDDRRKLRVDPTQAGSSAAPTSTLSVSRCPGGANCGRRTSEAARVRHGHRKHRSSTHRQPSTARRR